MKFKNQRLEKPLILIQCNFNTISDKLRIDQEIRSLGYRIYRPTIEDVIHEVLGIFTTCDNDSLGSYAN